MGTQAELQLMGSTITEINDVLTAIADYGYESYMNKYQVFAVLFHEMHHAYHSLDNYLALSGLHTPKLIEQRQSR